MSQLHLREATLHAQRARQPAAARLTKVQAGCIQRSWQARLLGLTKLSGAELLQQ
jgi:hypothetical protein